MQIILAPLMGFFSNVVAKFFTDQGLKFVAYKSLIFTFLTVTFPAVIKQLLTWMMEGLLSIAGNVEGVSDFGEATVQLTGLAAYLASNLMLPECVAILLTACAIRMALNFIPFIG